MNHSQGKTYSSLGTVQPDESMSLAEGKTLLEGVGAGGELRDREVELIMAPSQREKRMKPRKRKHLVPVITCPILMLFLLHVPREI